MRDINSHLGVILFVDAHIHGTQPVLKIYTFPQELHTVAKFRKILQRKHRKHLRSSHICTYSVLNNTTGLQKFSNFLSQISETFSTSLLHMYM